MLGNPIYIYIWYVCKRLNKLINTCVFFTSDDGKLLRGRHRQADEHEQINDDWNQHSRIHGGCEKTTTIRISDNELGDP